MSDDIALFVKFHERKYIKRLFDGKVYFSNAEHFRGIEKKNGLKGQGDAYEAFFQLKCGSDLFVDDKRGLVSRAQNATVNLELDDSATIPVFCIACFNSSDFTLEKHGEKNLLKIHTNIAETIRSHFPKADTAGVFYSPKQFIKSMEQIGIVTHDRVQYFNFNHTPGVILEMLDYINQCPGKLSNHNILLTSGRYETVDGKRRTEFNLTTQSMKRILFCKDAYFEKEKEYRFILPNKRINTPQDFYVRWLSQKKRMFPLDEFFSGIEV